MLGLVTSSTTNSTCHSLSNQKIMNKDRLLDRFLQYVKIDTTAVEQTDAVPSSPGQLEIGKLLASQLKDMGLADVTQDAHGIVMGTVPATADAPTVAFNSHVDTSPDASGTNVNQM